MSTFLAFQWYCIKLTICAPWAYKYVHTALQEATRLNVHDQTNLFIADLSDLDKSYFVFNFGMRCHEVRVYLFVPQTGTRQHIQSFLDISFLFFSLFREEHIAFHYLQHCPENGNYSPIKQLYKLHMAHLLGYFSNRIIIVSLSYHNHETNNCKNSKILYFLFSH